MKKSKKILMIVISIMFILLVAGGLTYAFWRVTKKQGDTNDLIATCLDLELQNEVGTFGLENAWPMSDTDAIENLSGYTFTVKNKCSTDILYEIGFDSLSMDDVTYLDTNYLKLKLDNKRANIYYALNDVSDVSRPNARASKVLGGATVKGNSTNTHNLKVWVDLNAPTSEINTYFKGLVFISAGTNLKEINDKVLLASGDISRTISCRVNSSHSFDECTPVSGNNVRYEFYDDGTLKISGTGAIKADYVEDDGYIVANSIIKKIQDDVMYEVLEFTELEQELIDEGLLIDFADYFDKIDGCAADPNYNIDACEHLKNYSGKYDPELWKEVMGTSNEELINAVVSLIRKDEQIPKIKNVIIDEGITSISEAMFQQVYIDSLTLPNSLTEIGFESFESVTLKGDLIFPTGVTNISEYHDPWLNTPKGNKLEFKGILTGEINLGDVDFTTIRFNNDSTMTSLSLYLRNKDDNKLIDIYVPESVTNVYVGDDGNGNTHYVNLKFYGPERTIENFDASLYNSVTWEAE